MTDVLARRPGGLARLARLVVAVAGYLEIFAIGFPPASRERLPVLALSAALALAAAWNPGRGLAIFAFLAPVAGLGGRLSGGVDVFAWPLLLFLAMAAGWAFRFLYDFESVPDPSRPDRALRVLVALWTMSAALAVVSARTVWALVRGLQLRAVNVDGLPDRDAIRTSVLSFAVLAAGAAFFFLARRAGARDRERALRAAVAGIVCSAAVAVAERLGVFGRETRPYWRIAGRYSGAAVDPNALGILCACGTILAAAVAAGTARERRGALPAERSEGGKAHEASRGGRRAAAAIAVPVLAAGLALSGSRSGFALAAIGLAGLLFARAIPGRRRAAAVALAAALVAVVAAKYLSEARGSAGARVLELFDARVPFEYRVSTRPVLWQSAVTLFSRHPVGGTGLGAFSWQLPNLLAETGRSIGATDNPGNAYLQALAETGLVGFVLTVAFLGIVAAESWSSLRDPGAPALAAAAGAAVLAFLAALLTGSHWLSPDVAFTFFLAAAVASRRAPTAPRQGARAFAGAALAAYAAAALVSAAATSRAAEAFRYRPEMGFYAPETGPGGSYRWTRKRFAVRIEAGETARLELVHFTPESASVNLEGLARGMPVFERSLAPGEAVRLRLQGPADAPAVFRFALSRAFVPRQLGASRDSRELGLMALARSGH